MTLEQSGPNARRLRRTGAFKGLDPTEKGSANYFLGLVLAKLFAAKCLDVEWLLHLDVYHQVLGVARPTGRSRPDLVGQSLASDRYVLECKGRAAKPSADDRAKAKVQAKRIKRVSGKAVKMKITTFSYFANDVLQFLCADPPIDRADERDPLPDEPRLWRYHYLPTLGLVRALGKLDEMRHRPNVYAHSEALDLQVSMHPAVLENLLDRPDADPRAKPGQIGDGPYGRDGIALKAGPSWRQPFRKPGPRELE